jgi:acetyltransferase
MLGVVRIIADSFNEAAEFAIVIGDPWQGKGLGEILMDYILKIAQSRGIKKIYARVLSDNERMLVLMRKYEFTLHKSEDDFYAEKHFE